MADAEKKTFPYIANKNWWELRRRWLGSPPSGPVTVTYLESALGLNQGVAQYLQGQLQLVGLIDAADKMTDLAHEWRHDDDYAAACAKMLKALYPVELLDAVPPSSPDRQAATRWFMKTMGTGQVTANQKAAFYQLLASGDPAAEGATATATRTAKAVARGKSGSAASSRAVRRPQGVARVDVDAAPATLAPEFSPRQPEPVPSVHIDLQVHIAAGASAEQIDQVFASMAKHLYKR